MTHREMLYVQQQQQLMAQQQCMNPFTLMQQSMLGSISPTVSPLAALMANTYQRPKTDYEIALEELNQEFPGIRDYNK